MYCRQQAPRTEEFVNNVLGKNDDITYFEYVKKNNREKGTADADKYSELIQVLVKPATKKELQTRAIIEGKTLSCLMRNVCEEEANKEYEVQ
mgnify:CR=1 FL=1